MKMEPMFRSAMFGFHKQDVNDFILKISKKHETEIAEKDAQISSLQTEYARSEELALQRERACGTVLEQNKKNLAVSRELSASLEKFLTAKAAFVAAGEDHVRLLKSLQKSVQTLSASNESMKSYQKKAEKFDKLASVLSSVVNGEEIKVEAEDPEEPAPVCVLSEEEANAVIETQNAALQNLLTSLDELLAQVEKFQFENS